METTKLSRAEMEALRQLAGRLGVTVEEAAEAAFKHGLDSMFRLPHTQGQVVPFEGLNRPLQSPSGPTHEGER